MKLVFLTAIILSLASLILGKTAQAVPLKELRRRARAKDPVAASVYKAAAYGKSLELFLGFTASLGLGAAVLIAGAYSWWAGLGLFLVAAGLFLVWRPARQSRGWSWKVSARLAPPAAWVLSRLHPLTGRAGDNLLRRAPAHSGAYEKEDLLELIKAQNHQPDNRIPPEDLRLAAGALSFGDKTVASVMTPRRRLKLVSEQEPIGPLLMDELHASGQKSFPVVSGSAKAASPHVVSTLYLQDLVTYSGKGKVKDVAKPECYFINESQSLRQALSTFLKTRHHLLTVVNDFEEIVGVITMEDVLGQIIGKPITDEFDKPEDLQAVARQAAKTEATPEQQRKSPEQTPESVLELHP